MGHTRAALHSESDSEWSEIKKFKRKMYLESAIHDFVRTKRELASLVGDLEYTSEMARVVLETYEQLRTAIARKVHGHPNARAFYDHHKIIAGTQAAIMTILPLRTPQTLKTTRADILAEYARYVDVIALNANLAVFISLDILYNWYGLSSSAFRARPSLVGSCTSQLMNYCGRLAPSKTREEFPLFWCSMLWYTIEEILRLHQPATPKTC